MKRGDNMTLDEVISEFDRGLRSMTGISRMSRPMPESAISGSDLQNDPLSEELQLTEKSAPTRPG